MYGNELTISTFCGNCKTSAQTVVDKAIQLISHAAAAVINKDNLINEQ